MDTVWIRLRAIRFPTESKVTIEEEHFMFGPTGIVHFKRMENTTNTELFNSNGRLVATVEQDQHEIFSLIAKIRGTDGNKSREKKNSKTKASRKKV